MRPESDVLIRNLSDLYGDDVICTYAEFEEMLTELGWPIPELRWHYDGDEDREYYTDKHGEILFEVVNETERRTLDELSDMFNIPHSTLRQAAWSGRLKARKSGRTWLATAEAVREFIENRWQR